MRFKFSPVMSLLHITTSIDSLSRCHILAAALMVACSGCRSSGGLAMEEESNRLPSIAFGASAWREYLGVDVGEEPRLPANIGEILSSKTPFLLEDELVPRRVGDNHLLTLIPSMVDGKEFTLDQLGELILRNHNSHFSAFQPNSREELGYNSHGYGYYSEFLTEANCQVHPVGSPYWVLLTKTILKDSRYKSVSHHKAMMAGYGDSNYKLPRALEVATSLLVHYARNGGERLYANKNQKSLWTYTRCSDVDKDGNPLAVGGFEVSGLSIHHYFGNFDVSGVSGSRRLQIPRSWSVGVDRF